MFSFFTINSSLFLGDFMNPQEIKEFLKSIKDTDIEELQYQSGGSSLYFKKNGVEAFIPEVKEAVQSESVKPKEPPKPAVISIKSTMVGTFSSAPNNEKPPFVREGSEVEPGQKVGQIEAMKIIKDVNAKTRGRIVKVCVSNGESVEYGQELFLVEPAK
jgi:acetyl-CoA carboxylase biotin carboxyl carrier protein